MFRWLIGQIKQETLFFSAFSFYKNVIRFGKKTLFSSKISCTPVHDLTDFADNCNRSFVFYHFKLIFYLPSNLQDFKKIILIFLYNIDKKLHQLS